MTNFARSDSAILLDKILGDSPIADRTDIWGNRIRPRAQELVEPVEPGKSPSKTGDLFVYGSTLMLTVADVAKNILTLTSRAGGDVANWVSTAGDAEILITTGLTLFNASRANPYSELVVWSQRLALAASAATLAEHLAGFGQPDAGAGFTRGAGNLQGVKTTLAQADPRPEQWSGDAAQKYAALNAEQKAFIDGVIGMAVSDQEMAKAVAAQAGDVELVRKGIASAKTVLATAALVCASWAALAAAPDPGQPSKLEALRTWVNYFAGLVLVIAGGFGITGIVLGSKNAEHAAVWRTKYEAVAEGAAKMLKA